MDIEEFMIQHPEGLILTCNFILHSFFSIFFTRSTPYPTPYWQAAAVTIPDSGMAQVAFYTKRGLGFRSDFALDDIEIGPCSDLGNGKHLTIFIAMNF